MPTVLSAAEHYRKGLALLEAIERGTYRLGGQLQYFSTDKKTQMAALAAAHFTAASVPDAVRAEAEAAAQLRSAA